MSWSKDIDSLRAQASKRGVLILLIASWRIDIYFPGKWLSELNKIYIISKKEDSTNGLPGMSM
jgi:hypothetical protein